MIEIGLLLKICKIAIKMKINNILILTNDIVVHLRMTPPPLSLSSTDSDYL